MHGNGKYGTPLLIPPVGITWERKHISENYENENTFLKMMEIPEWE